jgi:hypothetical protein
MVPTDPDKLSADIQALAVALDSDVVGNQGTLAARPAASLRGNIYVVQGDATPANNNVAWWDTGSTWIAIGANPLSIVARAGSFEAKSGELVMPNASITVTLPAPVLNAIVGVSTYTGATIIKQHSTDLIQGDFVSGVASVTLTAFQHVILQADGNNWNITAGEPKREQTYSAQVERTMGTEYEASATRPAMVVVRANVAVLILVGGVEIGETAGQQGMSFILNPGQKWKATGGAGKVFSSYLLL